MTRRMRIVVLSLCFAPAISFGVCYPAHECGRCHGKGGWTGGRAPEPTCTRCNGGGKQCLLEMARDLVKR